MKGSQTISNLKKKWKSSFGAAEVSLRIIKNGPERDKQCERLLNILSKFRAGICGTMCSWTNRKTISVGPGLHGALGLMMRLLFKDRRRVILSKVQGRRFSSRENYFQTSEWIWSKIYQSQTSVIFAVALRAPRARLTSEENGHD